MSRTRHPRPTHGRPDTTSRVTQAAIACADTFNRFERDIERLRRAINAARDDGVDNEEITLCVNHAATGRADRRAALLTIVARIAAAPSNQQEARDE